ncbi:hypothetical protein [Sphingobacterium hotanense]|uniref:hypothetical protein n=1 Tax=Sphingobacterium hotanense TaxID=649196 RepID=UPI0011F37F5A|nr:hypothetical protein [Sphingobacterium hotanense]
MKYIVLFFIFSWLFISFESSKSNFEFDKILLQNIVNEDHNNPSTYYFPVFISYSESEKGLTYIDYLNTVYNQKSIYEKNKISYEKFISDALSQKKKFLKSEIDADAFKINSRTFETYYKFGLKYTIEKHLEIFDEGSYKLKKGIEKSELYTLMYLCFTNGSIVIYDDYIDIYFIEQMSSFY